ncbi:hypothetical protein Bca4012_076041 [Brassica carinata]|uniref:(rape) hypothetical protein n=3 Tax=Brassica TaxID=3705 RepID=A0A816M224_BRANA|nr:unnamed protein product [Brassica napus]
MLSIHPYGSHVIPVYRGIWSVFQMSISLSSLPRRYMESVCILSKDQYGINKIPQFVNHLTRKTNVPIWIMSWEKFKALC